MPNILVLADHDHGTPRKVTAQMLTAARDLDAGTVDVAVFGPGAREAAEGLGDYGADRAYVWEGEEARQYSTEPLTAALVVALEAARADVVLYPADPLLSDVVGRAAVRTDGGVIGDVDALELDGPALVATKAIFGGDMVSRCTVVGERPQYLGVKANAFAAEARPGSEVEVVPLDVAVDAKAKRAEIVDVHEEGAGDRPDMGEAAFIVAGGRGLGDEQGFTLIEEVADVLGAAVGASRAATDAGWYPHQHQIGQTGKTVAPQLYIGAGISGAIQHRAGMQTSQLIVAVNKDGDAPIFSIADFGVVGDLYKVLPALVEEIKQRKQ